MTLYLSAHTYCVAKLFYRAIKSCLPLFLTMSGSASWSEDDITALLDFLLSKKATAGDGMSFKAVIWNEAATVVNNVPGLKGA